MLPSLSGLPTPTFISDYKHIYLKTRHLMFPNLARCDVAGLVNTNDQPEQVLETFPVFDPYPCLRLLEQDIERVAQQLVMTQHTADEILRDLNQMESERPRGMTSHMRAIQNMLTPSGGYTFRGIGQFQIGYRIEFKNASELQVTVKVNKHEPYQLTTDAQSQLTKTVPVGWVSDFEKMCQFDESKARSEDASAELIAEAASVRVIARRIKSVLVAWMERAHGEHAANEMKNSLEAFIEQRDNEEPLERDNEEPPFRLLQSLSGRSLFGRLTGPLRLHPTKQTEFCNHMIMTILLMALLPLTHDAIAELLYQPGQVAAKLNDREAKCSPAMGQ